MPSDIHKVFSKCCICQNPGNHKNNIKNWAIFTEHSNELWEIDIIEPLQRHSRVKKYIIMAIEHLNKRLEARIFLDKRGENALDMTHNYIIKNTGFWKECFQIRASSLTIIHFVSIIEERELTRNIVYLIITRRWNRWSTRTNPLWTYWEI